MPRITSHDGAMEVTGSCHLIECGLHQGGGAVRCLKSEKFAFKPARIDAVILSQAHLDHSGLLPRLVRAGFKGLTYCTPATRNLLAIMLEDAANRYCRGLEPTNKHRLRKGQRLEQPGYETRVMLRVLEQCKPLDYDQWRELRGEIRLRFIEAGHILGSAMVDLESPADEYGDAHRLVFSGDRGNADTALMRRPAVPERADTVLMESACGNRDHKSLQDTLDEMAQKEQNVLDRNGADTQEAFQPNLSLTPRVEESIQINKTDSRSIGIAGSGMCTGGRRRHHFKHRVGHDDTPVIFVGCQAAHTLGRQLVDGKQYIRMFGDQFVVRAQIHTLGGFSAHAARSEPVGWAGAFGGHPKSWRVHGEPEVLEAVQGALAQRDLPAGIAQPGEGVAL